MIARLDREVAYLNPLPGYAALEYAGKLRMLLRALDGEIVTTAVVGDREGDLLDAEGQEVDRVREFLHGRVAMPAQPSNLRGRALAVLDTFADEFKPGADHAAETIAIRGAS